MLQRHLRTLILTLATPLVACGPPTEDLCAEVLAHLQELTGRPLRDPELAQRFVTSCVEAHDLERLACLRQAPTAAEALECKAVRKRPG